VCLLLLQEFAPDEIVRFKDAENVNSTDLIINQIVIGANTSFKLDIRLCAGEIIRRLLYDHIGTGENIRRLLYDHIGTGENIRRLLYDHIGAGENIRRLLYDHIGEKLL